MSNTRNRNRIALIAIFVLFFIPLLAAVILSSKWVQYKPEATVNLGTLVEPPVPLNGQLKRDGTRSAQDELTGRWVLIHPLVDGCDTACIKEVTDLRQIHIGTGRHQEAVAILLLAQGTVNASLQAELEAIYDRFVIASDPDGRTMAALAKASNGTGPARGSSFIADPEGNIMLRYDPDYPPANINKDLRKLLKWSGR